MEPRPVADEPAARLGMWVFLVTDAASFGALLLACAVLRASATTWTAHPLDLRLAAVATLALVGSSLTLMRRRVVATLVLGGVFLALQAFEYATLARHGVGFAADRAASIFFAATGWHGLHVIAGLIVLAAARRTSDGAAALFWQFVDAVWIVLFTVFYLAPRVSTPIAILIGVAAAVAFAAVVVFPMKLRSEPRAVKVGFVLPLALPVLFIVALVADALTRGPRP
jgi:heme/copper-type cytochrome/quinol oxidase subunit 3